MTNVINSSIFLHSVQEIAHFARESFFCFVLFCFVFFLWGGGVKFEFEDENLTICLFS